MKRIITISIAAAGLVWLSGCAHEQTTTTTTEETTIHRPVNEATTTETRTVRPGY